MAWCVLCHPGQPMATDIVGTYAQLHGAGVHMLHGWLARDGWLAEWSQAADLLLFLFRAAWTGTRRRIILECIRKLSKMKSRCSGNTVTNGLWCAVLWRGVVQLSCVSVELGLDTELQTRLQTRFCIPQQQHHCPSSPSCSRLISTFCLLSPAASTPCCFCRIRPSRLS